MRLIKSDIPRVQSILRSGAGQAWLPLVIVILLSHAGAVAAPVTILNSGFEDITGETITNEFTFGPLVGWDLYDPSAITGGGTGGTYFIGTLAPTSPTNFPTGAPEGQRVGIAYNRVGSGGDGEYGMQQTLADTLQPNTNYTLQVEIGNIASGTSQSNQFFNLDGFPGYRIDLLAGGVLLTQDNNSLNGLIPEGAFGTSDVSFSTGVTHAQLGQNLQVRLVNLNQVDASFPNADLEVDFDNIRLNAFAVPEPTCFAILSIASTLIIGRRRIRNR